MYQKIKAKFKANPTIFYACSIVASWAGVGSLMNFRTLAINNGAAHMGQFQPTAEHAQGYPDHHHCAVLAVHLPLFGVSGVR